MRNNDANYFQRKNGDREQMTGFRRADHFHSTNGKTVTAILVLTCIMPTIVNGFVAIFKTFTGNSSDSRGYSGGYDNNSNRNQSW